MRITLNDSPPHPGTVRYTDHEGRQYLGPMPLDDALALTEPDTNGLRVAVSVPYGDVIAIQWPHSSAEACGVTVAYLWTARPTGQGGSECGTGRWIEPETEYVPSSWRPANPARIEPDQPSAASSD